MTYQSASATQAYRQRTDEHDQSPINSVACGITFKCKECKQIRSINGRKSRGYKAGFRCADCHTEKPAAKSADEKNPASSVLRTPRLDCAKQEQV